MQNKRKPITLDARFHIATERREQAAHIQSNNQTKMDLVDRTLVSQ